MPVFDTLRDRNRLTDTVVILDIFRASNTIIELLHRGADRVAVVENLDRARELKSQNPDWIVLGERGGEKVAGFDGDNSPTGITEAVSGKTIALTTSGGARCISACGSDKQVIVGSFANANAVLSFVRNLSSGETSFWAVGEKAEETAAEDIACAEFLESQVADSEHEFARILQNLLQSRGADRLRHLGQNVDLDYCVTLNSRHIVPVRADIVDDLSIFVGVLI